MVTTKRGKTGKPKYNVRYDNSVNTPTQTLKFADPITYMNLYNEAQLTRNPYQVPEFSADKIYFSQRTLAGAPDGNPYVYPAVDWLDLMFRKYSKTQKVNASVSGGVNQPNIMFPDRIARIMVCCVKATRIYLKGYQVQELPVTIQCRY
ncbi:hypothetical protein [Niabella hibiscisoli]|uniref:hypothetical protein n=1 Tax=Niabella hibiscisoli TaxID=1825928 RepID=UPI001F0D618B|nr:hypothetical protein [Niabella hibiscisoli]MCH5719176.1 hypothetical protein [Niabella hibiscisoli]